MTSHLLVKNCNGGHICHPPKECCKQGCCYPDNMSVYRPPPLSNVNMFPPLFVGHWYFWAAITATLAGILCACSLWRRHSGSGGGGGGGGGGGSSVAGSTTSATSATAGSFGSFFCCTDGGGSGGGGAGGRPGDEGISEPDSNGSCYAPPQYSRCGSFHQAPPPYTEVTSKPDLYPLVIGYSNRDTVLKTNGPSTGYLMVQYFRNFIVRPVGSLSATSTIDSLSSSFICNAANEANTIIPPTYSCMGSLEEVCRANHSCNSAATAASSACATSAAAAAVTATCTSSATFHELPAVTCTNVTSAGAGASAGAAASGGATSSVCDGGVGCGTVSASASVHSLQSTSAISTTSHKSSSKRRTTTPSPPINHLQSPTADTTAPLPPTAPPPPQPLVKQLSDCTANTNNTASANNSAESSLTNTLNKTSRKLNLSRMANRSVDSDEDHNFSDLLNLSICASAVANVLVRESQQHNPHAHTSCSNSSHMHDLVHMQNSYSVTNSMTSSDISSLANLGTPDSPPRATSPTLEMKELLDKIQQLPQQRSPVPEVGGGGGGAVGVTSVPHVSSWTAAVSHPGKVRAYFHRSKAKTMYMPLYEGATSSADRPEPPRMLSHLVSPTAATATATTTTTVKSLGGGALCHVFGGGNGGGRQMMKGGGWLSRSAPNTPCAPFAPSFPTIYHHHNNTTTTNNHHKRHQSTSQTSGSNSRKGSKSQLHTLSDGSPLLNADEDDDEDDEDERGRLSEPTNADENL